MDWNLQNYEPKQILPLFKLIYLRYMSQPQKSNTVVKDLIVLTQFPYVTDREIVRDI
jgi:hypothetical protein